MVKLRKLECTICTKDGQLPEYCDTDMITADSGEAYPVRTVFIPAKDGERFIVKFSVHSLEEILPVDRLNVVCAFDGVQEPSGATTPSLPMCTLPLSIVIPGHNEQHNGVWVCRNYQFSPINVSEDGETVINESMGEIKIIFLRYAYKEIFGQVDIDRPCSQTGISKPNFSEGAMKGRDITHSVRFATVFFTPP
jgi:hypothetical protein